MGVRVFNPKTRAFQNLNFADSVDLPPDQLVLVNILIELQTLTMQMHANSPGISAEDAQQMRLLVTQEQ